MSTAHTDAEEQTSDNAAAAFDAMREELALLRAAVRGFAARQDEIAQRDYSKDLARLIDLQGKLVGASQMLAQRPALALTPEGMLAEIKKASVAARQADHQMLTEGSRKLSEAGDRLDTIVGQVRGQRQQLDGLIWAWLAGAATILAIVIGRLIMDHPLR